MTLESSAIPEPVTLAPQQRHVIFGMNPRLPESEGSARVVVVPLDLSHVLGHDISQGILGELKVGNEMVRLRWLGPTEAQLSSLFRTPGGARRVTLAPGMGPVLDAGENQLSVIHATDGGAMLEEVILTVRIENAATMAKHTLVG